MTDVDATRDQLAEYLRTNPDTSANEAVGHVGADPSVWIDPVVDALNAEDPHAALTAPPGHTHERGGTEDTDTSDAVNGHRELEESSDDPERESTEADKEVSKYRRIYEEAAERADRELWEPVEETALREALDAAGFAELLDNGTLFDVGPWRFVDVSDEDEDPCRRWYYPSGDDPRSEEFRQFDELLREAAPDGYEPHYFRVARAGKDPATQFGGWKDEDARLSVEEAVAWMKEGGNVGIAGTPDDALVNVDIDNDEETAPEDVPQSLRARSRSRTGWHTWFFDPDGEIPNIPTDGYGEVRTDWQYVVAPGSFVASCREDIPADADDPGYYTVENADPVARIEYDDLPDVFHHVAEEIDAEDDGDVCDHEHGETTEPARTYTADGSASAVFDVEAADLVSARHDASDRFSSLFHGSETGANMSVSGEKLHCWRHGVAHGGLQALATLSEVQHVRTYGCREIGAAHKNSGAGTNALRGDWRLVWGAWYEAKQRSLIPDDDPIPYRVLRELAVADGLVARDDLIERNADTGRVAREDTDADTYTALPSGTYNDALNHVTEEHDIEPGRDPAGGGTDSQTQNQIETCDPPTYDPDTFERRERWNQLQGGRYDAVLDHAGVWVWNDPAGSGKTTNATIASLQRDRSVAVLFDKHEKAREAQTDDALPDGFDPYHLKGAEQKRRARCMDADHAGEECPDHGHTRNCPSMCPVYDLNPDHETRRRYEAVAREVGDVQAHLLLGEDLPGHDNGRCDWVDQFDAVESAEHVVGVHEYQRLKTVRDGRDVIIDESPSSLRETTHVDIEGLVRTANALDDLADVLARDDPTKHTAEAVAGFVRDIIDAATGDAILADIDPPTVIWKAYESYDDAAGNYFEREESGEEWQTAEALAQLKVGYAEMLISRIKREEWDGTPVGLDAVITAADEAGLSGEAVRTAVAAPTVLDSCPWCHSPVESHNGARACSSDTCDWNEHEHTITQRDGEQARAKAYFEDGPAGIGFERLPVPSDLPSDPLILDATATSPRVAHLYGIDSEEIHVAGDDDLKSNMRATQVLDGQYHAGTIDDSDTIRDRIQATIDKAGTVYDRPLFIIKKGLRSLFDFPVNAEILHYHAARGLNRNDCDAVVCIGAPHPKIDDLQREAELLAQGTDTRVGGAEHSTRRDAPNPPVYRILNYEDADGSGRAVPTKHYTGLVGELFRETREKEIEQAVHRSRPLLAEDSIDVYLLTNVPTSLRIDTVCSFKELADPLQVMIPVRDGALELLAAIEDTFQGNGPDGFRPEQLVEPAADGTISHKIKGYHRLAKLSGLDVTERTVRNYINDLEGVGLLDAEKYEQRAGVSYTADRSTLKTALSVLTYNESFKVAARRRLQENIDKAASVSEWLDWAREAFGLEGDRCDFDPPPSSTV